MSIPLRLSTSNADFTFAPSNNITHMDNVFFTPYIGPNYPQGYKGKKILALGESHYINDDDEGRDHFRDYPQLRHFTSDIVQRYLNYLSSRMNYRGWMGTYTKFARAFYNGNLSFAGIADFWSHTAFYNYIQEPIAKHRRKSCSQNARQPSGRWCATAGRTSSSSGAIASGSACRSPRHRSRTASSRSAPRPTISPHASSPSRTPQPPVSPIKRPTICFPPH